MHALLISIENHELLVVNDSFLKAQPPPLLTNYD